MYSTHQTAGESFLLHIATRLSPCCKVITQKKLTLCIAHLNNVRIWCRNGSTIVKCKRKKKKKKSNFRAKVRIAQMKRIRWTVIKYNKIMSLHTIWSFLYYSSYYLPAEWRLLANPFFIKSVILIQIEWGDEGDEVQISFMKWWYRYFRAKSYYVHCPLLI